jgi:hypothetical protein
VPKCEIFDRLDFLDFYNIKPFCVGDFWKDRHHLISYAHKFLMRMLSARISSLRIFSTCFERIFAQRTLKGTQEWEFFGSDIEMCTISLLALLKY